MKLIEAFSTRDGALLFIGSLILCINMKEIDRTRPSLLSMKPARGPEI